MKFFIFLLLISSTIYADDVDVIKSMYGGVAKKTDTATIEFVQTKDQGNLYITGPQKNNMANQKLSVSAIANINGKEYPLILNYENDHYSLSPYAKLKDEKNFVLSFTISFPFPGKTEKAVFKIAK